MRFMVVLIFIAAAFFSSSCGNITDNATRTDIGNLQVFPADNPWNTDISSYPVHPDSNFFIASIGIGHGPAS